MTDQRLAALAKLAGSGDYRAALREIEAFRCPAEGRAGCEARLRALEGKTLLMLGEYEAGERSFEAALRLYRSVGDRARVVEVLNNLGSASYFRGDYALAYERYEQARSELEPARGAEWFASESRFTAANLAALYQRLGRYRQALELYQWIGDSPAGLSAAERAQVLSNLAVLNRRLGDPWKARTLLEAALRLLDVRSQSDTWLGIVKNLGIVLALDFQDHAGAESRFDAVLREAARTGNAREAMQARLYLAETYFRRRRYAEAAALWATTLDESRRLDTAEEQWRSLFGLARARMATGGAPEARALLAECITAIETLRGGIGQPSLKSDFLADKTAVYEEAISLAAGSGAGAVFDIAERSRALLLREGAGHRTRLPLADFQSRLRTDEAAVVYHLGRTGSFALAVTSGSASVHRIELDEAAASRLIEDFRAQPSLSSGSAKTLAARLLAPLAPLGGEHLRRLWIVPDGALAFLPFEALPWKGRYLVDAFEAAYLPAASFLRGRPASGGAPRWPWERELVAYAEPDPARARLQPGDERWSSLPQSGPEVDAIARLLPGRAMVLRGASVPAPAVLKQAGGVPILHLATHGAGDPEAPERNRLLVGASYIYGGQLSPGSLSSLRLAVLSACETDTGPLRRGEGVQSLARDFLLAGAGATVASLWKVDDLATRLFMERFYSRYARGGTVAGALRETKLEFIGKGGPLADPLRWAAFVAQGSADQTAPRWISWTQLLLAAAAVFAAAALLLSRLRSAS